MAHGAQLFVQEDGECRYRTIPTRRGAEPGDAQAGAPRSILVRLNIAMIHCMETTEGGPFNTDDETYVEVHGATPAGAVDKRLPGDDDYYSVPPGRMNIWIDRDGHQRPRPLIWAGELAEGQTATFNVTIRDQDNKSLHIFVQGRRVFGSDQDDHIGSWGVRLTNRHGKLEVQWEGGRDARYLPNNGNTAVVAPEPFAAFFACRGYNLIAHAMVTTPDQLAALDQAEMAQDRSFQPKPSPIPMSERMGLRK
jgi:hypothetical protein